MVAAWVSVLRNNAFCRAAVALSVQRSSTRNQSISALDHEPDGSAYGSCSSFFLILVGLIVVWAHYSLRATHIDSKAARFKGGVKLLNYWELVFRLDRVPAVFPCRA